MEGQAPVIPRLTNPPLHESIANVPEARLVERLVATPHWRTSLLSFKGMPDNPRVLQTVSLREFPGGFAGDVDIALCAADHPSVATAIEVKRIKIGASSFATGRPNKLQEYDKAVTQANRLAEVGFAQVYLFVIVVVDSRTHNEGRYTYDGATPELRGVVRAVVSPENLTRRVGLVVHELVQSMDHPPLTQESHGGSLLQAPTLVPQVSGVTEAMARLLGYRA